MSDWWVATTNIRCERRATAGLKDRGFEVWTPMRSIEVRIGPRRHRACRIYPAFPGYLFVRSTGLVTWHNMIGVDGLKGMLQVDWTPLRVSDAVVAQLKGWLALDAVPVVEDAYRVGQAVRITSGPFASFDAVIKRLVGERMVVEVELFGRTSPVDLERGQIERVER